MSGALVRLADLVESLEAAQLTYEDACKMHAREMRIIRGAYGRFLERNRDRNRAMLNKGVMAGCLD